LILPARPLKGRPSPAIISPAMKKQTQDKAVLLFSCPDQRGIVSEVTHFISTYSGNIITSHQHRDPETSTFFMRVAWDLSDFTIPRDKIKSVFEGIALKYKMQWRIAFATPKTRMAIFVSQYDHCLYELLYRHVSEEMDCEIVGIVSNHETSRNLAEYYNIPFHHIPVLKGKKKEAEEMQVSLMQELDVDLIILARYMQILSDTFVNIYSNRIINIHHSFLPAFIGAKPYHQAYERGVKIIGATSHYVTAELDQGPIIEQDVTRISHEDDVQALVIKGRNLEKHVLTRAVQLHLEHKVLPCGNKTVIFD